MKLFHLLACLTTLIAMQIPLSATSANDTKPFVIPELRQWKGSEGEFTPTSATRIVYSDPSLRQVAEEFAADYDKMFGLKLDVTDSKAAKGDIVMTIKADKKLGEEGYTVNIADKVTITAPQTVGVYWATRTLLQMREQGTTWPKGKITDWPDYGLRGFSLDVGRKFFPMTYLRDLVKTMSYYKMNSLRIHLNDNGFVQFYDNDWNKTYAAFRLECDTYPGITARDGYYTKEEFKNFQREAASQFVTIVPEIDVPAHALAFSHYKPEIGSKEFGMDHLDLFNPETVPFIDALFKEYLEGDDPVFVGEYVHIGTDEFGKDYPGFDKKQETIEKFRAFMDHYLKLVKSYGKHPWVWGSLSIAPGETPIETEGVYLDAWYNGYADPKEMVDLGFKLNSVPDGFVYIVPLAGYYYDYLNTEWLYDNWTPAKVGKVEFPEKDPALLGGYFAEWNDHVGNGVTVKDVHHRVFPALQTMAVKLWDGVNVTVPYSEFDAARRIISEGPGVNQLALFGSEPKTVYQAETLRPGQETGIPEIGWDYAVEFDIDAAKEEPGTVLFSSPNATFYLADPTGGMLGFTNDGYLNKFKYAPYPGEKAHLRIEGDSKSTTLYVNGKPFETLDIQTRYFNEGKAKQRYSRTLVFPLEKAGNFKSKITNLKVMNHK